MSNKDEKNRAIFPLGKKQFINFGFMIVNVQTNKTGMVSICHTVNGFKLFLFYVLGLVFVLVKVTLKNMKELR